MTAPSASLARRAEIVYLSATMEGISAMTASPNPSARRDDAAEAPGDTARRLAAMAERLGFDRRDPERWHQDKSELIAALRRHARRLDQGTGR